MIRYSATITFVCLGLLLLGCRKGKTNGNAQNPSADSITKYDPVETRPPNSNYKPAFHGQTRTFGIKTQTPLKVAVINTQLDHPWGIAQLPDGKFLITQKRGDMVLVNLSGQIIRTITGLPAVKDEGQGGLLDICIDNHFEQNRLIYWSFSKEINGKTATALAKGKLSEDESNIEHISVIYEAKPAYNGYNHYGGRIIMDNHDNLLLSTGERYDKSMRHYAQETDNGLGKILRLKRDGTPVVGNPFVDNPTADSAVFSYGHRNVEGLAYDKAHDIIYQAEMGPMGGDEVNIIKDGNNYGWPVISYGLEYDGSKVGAGITQKPGMEQPIYYWDPSVSPSGMVFYNSNYIPEWQGNLLIGCLSGQHIVRLRLKDEKIAGEERLLQDEGQRFRDLTVGHDGRLYAITDAGRLYCISKK